MPETAGFDTTPTTNPRSSETIISAVDHLTRIRFYLRDLLGTKLVKHGQGKMVLAAPSIDLLSDWRCVSRATNIDAYLDETIKLVYLASCR